MWCFVDNVCVQREFWFLLLSYIRRYGVSCRCVNCFPVEKSELAALITMKPLGADK